MSNPNVREDPPPSQPHTSDPRQRARWAFPLLALMLLLLVVLAVRAPQSGTGSGNPGSDGNANTLAGPGQGNAPQEHQGSTTQHAADQGGNAPDQTFTTPDELASTVGSEPQPKNATAPQRSATLIPSHDTAPSTAATPAGNPQINPPRLPTLGFRTDLNAPPKPDPTPTPSQAPTTGTVNLGAPATPGLASFFGAQGHGSRFIYVIDKSGSMAGQPFNTAKQELIRSLRALQPHEHFFVTFYDNHAEPMPANRMLPATPQHIERTIQWVRTLSHGGGTNPAPAMTHALRELNPDTIWLLSDGSFNAQVVDDIAAHNPQRKVHINTVAFTNRSGEALLKIIASENNGDYRFVP